MITLGKPYDEGDYLPVYVVTKEQVVGSGRIATFIKMPQKVLILSVDVSADVHRSGKLHHHWLLKKQLPRLLAQLTDVCLR